MDKEVIEIIDTWLNTWENVHYNTWTDEIDFDNIPALADRLEAHWKSRPDEDKDV